MMTESAVSTMILAFSTAPSSFCVTHATSLPTTCFRLRSAASAFVSTRPLFSSSCILPATTTTIRCCNKTDSSSSSDGSPPPPSSSFTRDFFSGPSSPPRVRSLYQVILFSLTTNLLWYGWYKFCVEEEMRRETGEGLGGTLVLLPFVLGVSAPLFIADGSIAVGCALSGLGWILAMQYWWLCRVNELYCSRFDDDRAPPLTPTWAFIPPLNVVVGLRGIHFLAIANGGTAEDPVTKWFPFLGVERLGLTELVTSPKLWVSFGGGKKGGETEKER